jgi:hypothetical protein
VLVVFDATVLCGALRKPTGYNFKLLELADRHPQAAGS